LLEKAAEHSHPKAQYNLARRLLTGEGVEKNEHRARMLLMAAADAGERKAARTLRVIKHKEPPARLRNAAGEPGVVTLNRGPGAGGAEADHGAKQAQPPALKPSEDAIARAKAAAERRRSSLGGLAQTRGLLPGAAGEQRSRVSSEGSEAQQRRDSLGMTATGTLTAGRRRSLWVDLREKYPNQEERPDSKEGEGGDGGGAFANYT
jgi:hypothetical protein